MSDERKQVLKAQYGTPMATQGDVDAAFRLFLGRAPRRGEEPCDELIGKEPSEVFSHFMALPEFREDPVRMKIIASAAKLALASLLARAAQ